MFIIDSSLLEGCAFIYKWSDVELRQKQKNKFMLDHMYPIELLLGVHSIIKQRSGLIAESKTPKSGLAMCTPLAENYIQNSNSVKKTRAACRAPKQNAHAVCFILSSSSTMYLWNVHSDVSFDEQ